MNDSEKKKNIFFSLSFWCFLLTIGLLPLFFIPYSSLSISFFKILLLYGGISLSLLLFFLHLFNGGRLAVPKNLAFFAFLFIPIVFLLSTFFGEHPSLSFLGYGFETGTFAFIFLLSSSFILSVIFFQNKRRVLKFLTLFVLVFLALSVYHIARIFFGPEFLSFGIFNLKTGTPLGSWNDLSLLAGAVAILSALTLDFSYKYISNSSSDDQGENLSKEVPEEKKGRGRFLFIFSFLTALLVLVFTNLWINWLFLVMFSLVIIVFNLSSLFQKSTNIFGRMKMIRYTLAIFIIALVFVLPTGSLIGSRIYDSLGISYFEIRPSWSMTGNIFFKTISSGAKNFVLGSGPNSFLAEWRQWKPAEVSLSDYWNTEFGEATGLIPTFFITTGFLGLLVWLIYFAGFLKSGITYFLREPENYFSTSSFILACYLWTSVVFFSPAHVIFVLAVVFSGIFIGSLFSGQEKSWKISFAQTPRAAFALLIIFFAISALNISISFFAYRRAVSVLSFQRALSYVAEAKLDMATEELENASKLSPADIHKRTLAEVQALDLGRRASNTDNPSEEEINSLQNLINESLNNAESAIIWNPRAIDNWFVLARVYEILTGLGVEGAHEKAVVAYMTTQKFDPFNPLSDYLLAKFEVSLNNLSDAEDHIKNAISKKPNYVEAILLYSQIKSKKGELGEAIDSASEAVKLRPEDPTVYFQIGILYYLNENYKNAQESFEGALSIEPLFADARYFLGLTLDQMGREEEAIKHFEKLSEDFPENKEVRSILDNLKEGSASISEDNI